jgi:hypothetical protein
MKKIWLFALIIVGLAACKSTDPVAQPSRTELVTKNWKTETVNIVIAGSTAKVYPDVPQFKDAGYDFSKVKLVVRTAGTASLTLWNDSKIEGNWKFTDNETVVDVNNGQLKLKIKKLETSKLEFDTDVILDRDVALLGLKKGASVPATISMIPE